MAGKIDIGKVNEEEEAAFLRVVVHVADGPFADFARGTHFVAVPHADAGAGVKERLAGRQEARRSRAKVVVLAGEHDGGQIGKLLAQPLEDGKAGGNRREMAVRTDTGEIGTVARKKLGM